MKAKEAKKQKAKTKPNETLHSVKLFLLQNI